MSIPINNTKIYSCEICNKTYSTRQNLWKHNHKFHIEHYLVLLSKLDYPTTLDNEPYIIDRTILSFYLISLYYVFCIKKF